MALFTKKDKEKKSKSPKATEKVAKKSADKQAAKAETKAPAKTATTTANPTSKNLSNVILRPRITEKAALKAEVANAYTFEIAKEATKTDVAEAIEKIYKVIPTKVNIVKNPRKLVRNRKGTGFKGGVKKAIVFLKKGDKIEFV
jgi:large subunit ribosomal protein L23